MGSFRIACREGVLSHTFRTREAAERRIRKISAAGLCPEVHWVVSDDDEEAPMGTR